VSYISNHPWRTQILRKKFIGDFGLFMKISQVDFRHRQFVPQLLLLLKQSSLRGSGAKEFSPV
jgi:hypothetical protein